MPHLIQGPDTGEDGHLPVQHDDNSTIAAAYDFFHAHRVDAARGRSKRRALWGGGTACARQECFVICEEKGESEHTAGKKLSAV